MTKRKAATNLDQSIPQDPEARALIVGATIAADYAIAAWSNFLMWPAKQAPHCMKCPALHSILAV